MKTETITIYRGPDGKFAPPPEFEGGKVAHGRQARPIMWWVGWLLYLIVVGGLLLGCGFLAHLATLPTAYQSNGSNLQTSISFGPPPEPTPLLPHAAIEIPAPLDLPKWETPAPVFYFYDIHPTVHRSIHFNGNTR